MSETKNTANQTEPTTQPEDNGAQETRSDRTFTQEEVNRIVSDRLAKERSRAAQTQQTETFARTVALEARESRLACKEFLIEKGYPTELLDVIDTSNPDEFQSKVISACEAIARKTERRGVASPDYCPEPMISGHGGLHGAFEHGVKHEPRKF